jgi:hypothetical protein
MIQGAKLIKSGNIFSALDEKIHNTNDKNLCFILRGCLKQPYSSQKTGCGIHVVKSKKSKKSLPREEKTLP